MNRNDKNLKYMIDGKYGKCMVTLSKNKKQFEKILRRTENE